MFEFKTTLWEHQTNALQKILNGDVRYLEHDPGTGKTATGLRLITALSNKKKTVPSVLIICPKSVMIGWKEQAEMHCDPRIAGQFTLIRGDRRVKIRQLDDPKRTKILVVNYELFSSSVSDLLGKISFDLVIIDEAHRCKEPTGKRRLLIQRLCDKAGMKLLLSGTPVLNDATDLWGQLRLIGPDKVVDKNFFAWRARWFLDINAPFKNKLWYYPKWELRTERLIEFQESIAPVMHKARKEECLDLPPFVRVEVPLEMARPEWLLYHQMETEFIASLDNGLDCTAQLAITQCLRLQQITAGIFAGDGGETRDIPTPKLEALEDMLQDLCPKHKVIVWCNFIPAYRRIARVVENRDLRFVSIIGGQSDKERDEAIRAFSTDSSVSVCIANQAAGGVGLNLQAASISIFYSKNFDRGLDAQAEARCYRAGSEIHKSVTRYDLLVRNTIDERIHQALKNKDSLAKMILDFREDRRGRKVA